MSSMTGMHDLLHERLQHSFLHDHHARFSSLLLLLHHDFFQDLTTCSTTGSDTSPCGNVMATSIVCIGNLSKIPSRTEDTVSALVGSQDCSVTSSTPTAHPTMSLFTEETLDAERRSAVTTTAETLLGLCHHHERPRRGLSTARGDLVLALTTPCPTVFCNCGRSHPALRSLTWCRHGLTQRAGERHMFWIWPDTTAQNRATPESGRDKRSCGRWRPCPRTAASVCSGEEPCYH